MTKYLNSVSRNLDAKNRNWESIKESVGGYKIEEEGSRLFSKITGDFFSILGMPLIEINNYLSTKGSIDE